MGRIQNFFKNLNDKVLSKKYTAMLSNGLPLNDKVWDGNNYLTALELSLYTNKAIEKRAEKIGEIQFVIKDKNGEIVNKPNELLDLLYKPNKIFIGTKFWGLYQKYYDAIGEVFIYKEKEAEFGADKKTKKIKALHLLMPTNVEIIFGEDGLPEKYKYKTKNSETIYEKEDIIYIHNPDPKSPLRGQSILKSGINAIQTETQISTYHSRILENGGKVEGVFKFKGNLTKEQLNDLKDNYQKQYGSAKKAGLPLFLGGEAEYVKTGLTPNELAFLEAKKMTLDDICMLTGVPKSILGNTTDTKFENADADRAIFLRETIKPLMNTLTNVLDIELFPDEQTLSFIDPTPENTDMMIKETESGIKNYYMTINEARARHGLEPVDNGDEIMMPFNLVPLGTERVTGTKVIKEAGEHPLKDYDYRRLHWKVMIKRMDNREKLFKKVVDEYFDDQEKRLTNLLEPTKTRVFRKKGLFDELLSLAVEVKIGKEKFLPIMEELLKQAGIDAMELAGSKYDFVIGAEIKSWLDGRADFFLNSINETTFKRLKEAFQSSLDQEEGRDGLIRRIQALYGDIKKQRSALIARTEVHNATQYGTMQGYKQGGLTTKIWVSVMDSATRDSHASVDGEERPIDVPFSNGLMFPGDPKGSAEEVINCRCTI